MLLGAIVGAMVVGTIVALIGIITGWMPETLAGLAVLIGACAGAFGGYGIREGK